MPAVKSNIWELVRGRGAGESLRRSSKTSTRATPPTLKASSPVASEAIYPGVLPAGTDPIHFPSGFAERQLFRTSAGKKVTSHQWAVYDYILTIPPGRVSTYKSICDALGQGSPRSVGSALRNNPFAPYIPCHRVIASNLYLGGYCGEWGPQAKTGTQFNHKLKILSEEGVRFDSRGMLESKECLWKPESI